MNPTSEKFIEKHRGEILERAVRKSPYSIKTLAKKLGISRITLYNKFKESNLNYDFLLFVGSIIHYDIKAEIPELDTNIPLSINKHNQKVRIIEKQYMDLLEKYRKLFGFLTKIMHKHGLESMRKEIDKIVEKKIL